MVNHDEADISIISYILMKEKEYSDENNNDTDEAQIQTIRIMSDDTDVFVLLVYWVCLAKVKSHIQMEKWDGTILDINASSEALGPDKCKLLLAMHALTGCDTTSYLCGKGKLTAIKLLQPLDMGALKWLGIEDATQDKLMQGSKSSSCHSTPKSKVRL